MSLRAVLRLLVLISGGRINSRDVWMYNSQLNLWIRVASLNKGRWRHKMGVLLGKVSIVIHSVFETQCVCGCTAKIFKRELIATP